MSLYVKLRDSGSIFRDASQGVTIKRGMIVKVKPTSTINSAIRGGALVKVPKPEGDPVKGTAKQKEIVKEVEPNVDTENASNADSDNTVEDTKAELSKQYADKFGKPVPKNKANDIEWIKAKIDSE